MITKVLAIILAIGGGLSIGKEGPLVHVSGVVAFFIIQLPIFSHIHKNLTLRNQFLAASVAAGIASVFGSPIGAVLFSIEVTATYYTVSNMWRAAFCTIWCTIGYQLLQSANINDGISNTDFDDMGVTSELFLFILLGIGAGLMGTLFILVTKKLVYLRYNRVFPMLYGNFRYTLLVVVIVSGATFMTNFLEKTDRTVIDDMLTDSDQNDWKGTNFGMSLLIYMVVKLIVTSLSISAQIPAGVIFPLLTCGAVYGRLFGYIVDQTIGTKYAGIYAAVGAASLVSSVTHSVSIAIIVFEITGQIHYLVAMMIGVFLASGISNTFTVSFYDSMIEIKNLPYLPSLKSTEFYMQTAKEILDTQVPCIQPECTLRLLTNTILEAIPSMNKIPVIGENRVLLYDVSIESARKYINAQFAASIPELSAGGRAQLQRFFHFFMNIRPESFIDGTYQSFLHEEEELEDVKKFMESSIDTNHKMLGTDDSPFSIAESTPLAKIHFLFIMLGLTQVYVTKKGELVGIITRDLFVEKLSNRN